MGVSDTGTNGLFERAMDHWGRGDRGEAVRLLRDLLASEPGRSEAHDHLGLAALDDGAPSEAERHFHDAVRTATAAIEAEEGFLSWSNPLNRPYLRAHAHLALVFRRTGRWAEAAALHQQLLMWSPNDDLGVRFLLGEEHHRIGNLPRAASAHRASGRHPGAAFGLGLALLELGRDAEARVALLRGIALNRYLAPMLLGEAWVEIGGRPTRTGDPAFAARIVAQTSDLWRQDPARIEVLAELWDDPRVRAWRGDLDDLGIALEHAQDARRRALIERHRALASDTQVRALAAQLEHPLEVDDDGVTGLGGSWVTDMRHLVSATDPATSLPEEARQLAIHRGRIVEAITSWGRARSIDTAIACRRVEEGRACSGHVRAVLAGDVIDWSCNACGDSGRIGGWHGTPWDLGERAVEDRMVGIPVPTEWYDVLRNLPLGEARRPVARAVHVSEGAELHGTLQEYTALAEAAERAGALALVDFLRGTVHQFHD